MDLKPGWVDRIDWSERINLPATRLEDGSWRRGHINVKPPSFDEHEANAVHRLAVQAEEDEAFKFYDPHALTD